LKVTSVSPGRTRNGSDIVGRTIAPLALFVMGATVLGANFFGLGRSELAAAESVAIADFALSDFRGKEHSLKTPAGKAYVVAFLGTECPLAKLYATRLNQLRAEFLEQGVVVVGVNSNSHDSITELAAFANRHKLSFPMLKDPGNKIADLFKAERTPEVFLLDAKLQLQYAGRIDDQYGVGYARDEPKVKDLRNAIVNLLAGKEIEPQRTEAVGCLIGRVKSPDPTSSVTYSNQIARIFQKHCVECHRAGEIAPFELTEYDEVAGWADTILEVVDQQRMPPWHANPKHGKFVNQRLMTSEEKELIAKWVENGAPEGDPKNLPAPRKFTTGWKLPRDPDFTIAMRSRPFTVPATGTVQYQYFVCDPGFKEDVWVQAAEVIPGNRAVVHHALVFIRPPDGVQQRGIGWLGAYVPGQAYASLPDYRARRVPAGSKLVFQMHYTPVGSPQDDITRLGLIFADESKVTEEVVTRIIIDRKLEIPPRAANHRIEKLVGSFPPGSKLLGIAPHAHLRGRAFRFDLIRDGKSETLLDVPQYDFNWQHAYELETPLEIAGDQIRCVGIYNNSKSNLVNPDPDAVVRWGDQTWEEMFLAYFALAIPRENLTKEVKKLDPAVVEAEAKKFLKRLDKNEDGVVTKQEVPDGLRVFAFNRFDKNKDEVLSLEEAKDAARIRLRKQ